MAERVVDRLEVVEIDDDEDADVVAATLALQRPVQLPRHYRTIGELRQPVRFGGATNGHLCLLQRRDIRAHADDCAAGRPPFADLQPAPVRQELDTRLARRIPMDRNAVPDPGFPLLLRRTRIHVLPCGHAVAQDILERRALSDQPRRQCIIITIGAVEEDQPVLGIESCNRIGDRLDDVVQKRPRLDELGHIRLHPDETLRFCALSSDRPDVEVEPVAPSGSRLVQHLHPYGPPLADRSAHFPHGRRIGLGTLQQGAGFLAERLGLRVAGQTLEGGIHPVHPASSVAHHHRIVRRPDDDVRTPQLLRHGFAPRHVACHTSIAEEPAIGRTARPAVDLRPHRVAVDAHPGEDEVHDRQLPRYRFRISAPERIGDRIPVRHLPAGTADPPGEVETQPLPVAHHAGKPMLRVRFPDPIGGNGHEFRQPLMRLVKPAYRIRAGGLVDRNTHPTEDHPIGHHRFDGGFGHDPAAPGFHLAAVVNGLSRDHPEMHLRPGLSFLGSEARLARQQAHGTAMSLPIDPVLEHITSAAIEDPCGMWEAVEHGGQAAGAF